jgi:transcriptional regulator with XRE-family HTH domain
MVERRHDAGWLLAHVRVGLDSLPRHISYRELARRAGISHESVRNVANGKNQNPSIEVVCALYNALYEHSLRSVMGQNVLRKWPRDGAESPVILSQLVMPVVPSEAVHAE